MYVFAVVAKYDGVVELFTTRALAETFLDKLVKDEEFSRSQLVIREYLVREEV